MVEKKPRAPAPKDGPASKHARGKPEDKAAVPPPERVAVDRPGFDLGGSSGKTSAGSGLGLGEDAADNRRDRRLPGRRGKRT